MKKPIPREDTMCAICGKKLIPIENYGFSKTKQKEILYFHEDCYEKLRKKE